MSWNRLRDGRRIDPSRGFVSGVFRAIPGLALIPGCLFFCASCTILNPEYHSKHTILTRYKNGNPRTEFSYQKGEIVGGFRLYDSTGNLRLEQSPEDTSVSGKYFANSDVQPDSIDIKKLSAELSPRFQSLHDTYGRRLFPRFTGRVEYWLWINRDGSIEHAACRRLDSVKPSFIQGTLEDIEGWKLSPNLVGGGAVVRQQVFFEPYSHRTNILAFILGLAAVTAFFLL